MSPSAMVSVVGGVYRERVRYPHRDGLFGSGGRAAATIASLGATTKLFTAIDEESKSELATIAATFNFALEAAEVESATEFVYDHPLSRPKIRPMFGSVHLTEKLEVESDDAIVFGMVEGDARVVAKRIVYDPQNPHSPRWLEESGSAAEEIVYVLNQSEGKALTGEVAPTAIVAAILGRPSVSGCALKLGPHGALVAERGGAIRTVPCYETPYVWPIGSGDIFAATLAWAWLTQGLDVVAAGEAASRGAALYVASEAIPSDIGIIRGGQPMPYPALTMIQRQRPADFDVYLAGPFFCLQDQWLVEEVRDALQGFNLRVFSPLHDVGSGEAGVVAPRDLEALSRSTVVIALLDRLDPGTLFEVGFARAKDVPVVAHVHGVHAEHLKMVQGSRCLTIEDLTTALYRTAWEAVRG